MTQEAAQTPSPAVEPRKPSKGEAAFDWLVYGGIAGVGTFILTVPLAYAMKYKGGDAWLAKQLAKVGLKEGGAANTAITTTSLMHGGNVMAVPVYFAEKDRENIVDRLNKAMGDDTPKEAITPKPKQTILSVLVSRLTAWGAVFAGLFGASMAFPKTFTTFEDEFGRGFAKLLGKGQYKPDVPKALIGQEQEMLAQIADKELTSPLKGKQLTEALKPLKDELKIVREGLVPHETRTFRFGKIGALDVFATITAATLFFLGNIFFGKLLNEKKDDASAIQPVKKRMPIPNPTLPHAETVPEQKADFAARIAQERQETSAQEQTHAL